MAGVLNILGVDLGNNLMPADEFNEKGYFEHNAVFALNEEILNELGVNWHTTYLLEEDWENSDAAQRMIPKVQAFFRDYFLESKCFAIKDPRLSVLLPLWLKALKGEDLDTDFIIVIRHPDEVIASMTKPHPQIKERACLLWLDYNFRLEKATRDHKRFFVSFDTLIETPVQVVESLIDCLQIDLSPTQTEINEFVDSKLRHNRSNKKASIFLQLSIELYNTLREFGTSDNSKCKYIIDELYHRHIQLVRVYGEAYHKSIIDFELEEYRSRINQLQKQLHGVEGKFQDSKQKIEQLGSGFQDLEIRIESLQRLNIHLEHDIEIFRENSRLKDEKITDLREEIAYNERLMESYEGQISELEINISLLRDDVDRTQNLANRKEADSQKSYEIALKMIEQVSAERAKRKQQLEKTTEELATYQRKLHMVQKEFVGLQNHANNLDRDIIDMRNSASFKVGWWLTRPFSYVFSSKKYYRLVVRTLSIGPGLFLTLLYSPLRLLSHVNAYNFERFRSAISNEDPSQVLQNLRNYISRDKSARELQDVPISHNEQYQIFLKQNRLTESDIAKIKLDSRSFSYRPLISIIIPVFNTDPKYLNKCIWSVINQYYECWELCIHDDCSQNPSTIKCLQKWKRADTRIKISFGNENMHISEASNKAIKAAEGEFVALLDHDDEITPDALYRIVKALNKNPDLDFIYSDEDKIEIDGTLSTPHFKPDFNIDLLLSHNYICHFSVIRKKIGDKIGWFRKGYEGSQDYDLFLRIIERTRKIHHIHKVLYHWRKVPESTAASADNKSYTEKSSTRALTDYLNRNNIEGTVTPGLFAGSWRIKRKVVTSDLVSIIIPFKDRIDLLKQCLQSIFEKSIYENYEILLVSNNSQHQETFTYLRTLEDHEKIKILEYDIPFNFSKINNWAVERSSGKYILLLNNDTEVITRGWLVSMLEHIQRDEVGAVGAKLYYPNDTIQHAGVVIGIGGVAAHVHNNLSRDNISYFGRASILQDLSACTGACLLVKRKLFEQVGGLDEQGLKIAFNDIDLCLKIHKLGYLIVFTPYAELYHHESVSRGYEDTVEKQARFSKEVIYFQEKWKDELNQGDTKYNRNLTLRQTDFSLKLQ